MSITSIFENIVKLMREYWHVFLIEGVSYTLLLSVITVFFGAILGSLLALGKRSRFRIVRGIITAFVEVIRGTPILLQAGFTTKISRSRLYTRSSSRLRTRRT